MSATPQSAVPARSTNPVHSSQSNAPGAQPMPYVLSIGTGAARAPGFPIYARLAAMVARYERRIGFFWAASEPPRYQRLRAALRAAWSAPFPARRTRLMGSSLRQEMARDRDFHDRMLDALGYRTCPGPCALCDERAEIQLEDFYERQIRAGAKKQAHRSAAKDARLRSLATDGVSPAATEPAMAAPMDGRNAGEPACDCNGEGKCGYCAEEAVCRAEFYGDPRKECKP